MLSATTQPGPILLIPKPNKNSSKSDLTIQIPNHKTINTPTHYNGYQSSLPLSTSIQSHAPLSHVYITIDMEATSSTLSEQAPNSTSTQLNIQTYDGLNKFTLSGPQPTPQPISN